MSSSFLGKVFRDGLRAFEQVTPLIAKAVFSRTKRNELFVTMRASYSVPVLYVILVQLDLVLRVLKTPRVIGVESHSTDKASMAVMDAITHATYLNVISLRDKIKIEAKEYSQWSGKQVPSTTRELMYDKLRSLSRYLGNNLFNTTIHARGVSQAVLDQVKQNTERGVDVTSLGVCLPYFVDKDEFKYVVVQPKE